MLSFTFQSKALGRILFEQVCKQLNLLEVDYFGLEYQDGQKVTVRALFNLKSKVQAYYTVRPTNNTFFIIYFLFGLNNG